MTRCFRATARSDRTSFFAADKGDELFAEVKRAAGARKQDVRSLEIRSLKLLFLGDDKFLALVPKRVSLGCSLSWLFP